ncbi:FAD-dependent oxidoreductase [Amycolatopsis mongoliensis]|uniref:FAD-dependent oxidoreductase n=1 Tax=Amycolatopsis mongoliensis TaxID=715475 RepID=A0A9Y2NMW3_9PSEU|nr:FAD-dependent oxidoreductase [Amycolatopsis sp. 4-36]WIY07604.1 FAD-dependent oxidoreductase [Amycolatopsis sp. 4-36]
MARAAGVVVVGASIAGLTVVEELRSKGFGGPITLLESEDTAGYSRPLLSKGVLAGEGDPSTALLPAPEDLGVDVLRGTSARGLDLDRNLVELDGDALPFDKLVVATGARALTLHDLGANDDCVPEVVLRTMDDAVRLRDLLGSARTVLVVGGGVLGMEVASAASSKGLAVTVVDRGAPMARTGGAFLSRMVSACARERGVQLVSAPEGARLVERDSRPAVVAGGHLLEADVVVTAVGCRPNVEWLARTGLSLSPGVVVDNRCRVREHIAAAGDVVSVEGSRRQPHWSTALDQARVAADVLLYGDDASPYINRPYFWTDQFGLSVKFAGRPTSDDPELVDGSQDTLSGLWRWTDAGHPHAAVAINRRIPIARLLHTAGHS